MRARVIRALPLMGDCAALLGMAAIASYAIGLPACVLAGVAASCVFVTICAIAPISGGRG